MEFVTAALKKSQRRPKFGLGVTERRQWDMEQLRKETELEIMRAKDRVQKELQATHARELKVREELLQRRLAELGKPIAPTSSLQEEKVKPIVNCEETLPPETVGDGSEPHQGGKTGHTGAQCLAADGEEGLGLPGRKLTLPSFPEFSGDRSDDDAFDRWVWKLSRHAELGKWTDREKLLQMELHLSGRAE